MNDSRQILRPAAALLLVLLAWTAPARALTPLKEVSVLAQVSVEQKRVSLLDLCEAAFLPEEWRALMAKVDIGEAPAPGSEKYIDPEQLKAYLTRFINAQGVDATQVTLHLPEKIVVTTKSVELSQEQVEEIYRKFISENSPWKADDLEVQKVTFSGLPVLPAGEMTYEVVAAPRERFVGNVTVTVNFFVNGEKARSLRVSGRIGLFQNVLHTTRPLRQDEVIGADDLESQRIDVSDAPDRYATDPGQVTGKRVVKNVGLHQSLDLKDLGKPLVLRRGTPVTIVYQQPGLKVTARGESREDGGVGDTIHIANTGSKKIVQCQVLDAETVLAIR